MLRKIETNLKRKLYLQETEAPTFSPIHNMLENQVIYIDANFQFQTLLGFGGAFTRKYGICFESC